MDDWRIIRTNQNGTRVNITATKFLYERNSYFSVPQHKTYSKWRIAQASSRLHTGKAHIQKHKRLADTATLKKARYVLMREHVCAAKKHAKTMWYANKRKNNKGVTVLGDAGVEPNKTTTH